MSRYGEMYPQIPLCVEGNIRVYQNVQKACTNRGNTLRVYQDVQKTCTNRGNRELTPFGLMVKGALVKMQKTQVELAKSLGVSKQYLYLVLHGIRPGIKYIDQIVVYCELNPEEVEKVIMKTKQIKREKLK